MSDIKKCKAGKMIQEKMMLGEMPGDEGCGAPEKDLKRKCSVERKMQATTRNRGLKANDGGPGCLENDEPLVGDNRA